MRVVIVGGAGYIGATTAQLFLDDHHETLIIDNLSTGHRNYTDGHKFIEANILDKAKLTQHVKDFNPDVVLHFAAKIQVEESIHKPSDYFENNVLGSVNVIEAALNANTKNIVFSSTAAVYGEPERVPIQEDDRTAPINPYGLSKLMVEQTLNSYSETHGINWTAFRYFNAAGSYKGRAMDYPVMTHLIPHATEAVLANRPFKMYGDDYKTEDGSCVRDFVHVVDIARAHVLAAKQMVEGKQLCLPINLGSGSGYSVKQVLKAMKNVIGKDIAFIVEPRRTGDPAILIADSARAQSLLGWKPEISLEDIVRSHWEWRTTIK